MEIRFVILSLLNEYDDDDDKINLRLALKLIHTQLGIDLF